MLPIALLMIEHRQIERMLPVLREEAARARGGHVDAQRIAALVDFIRVYADRSHHGKEEDILFAELRDKPMPSELSAIMTQLIQDHETSRTLTKRVVDATKRLGVDTGALVDLTGSLEALAGLYPRHIASEDKDFFIPCMKLFTHDEQTQMLAHFQAFDKALVHKLYRERMDELAGIKGRGELRTKPSPEPGARWTCTVCDLVFDPVRGDAEHGIAPGTRFEDLPEDWVCPLCGATKEAFRRI